MATMSTAGKSQGHVEFEPRWGGTDVKTLPWLRPGSPAVPLSVKQWGSKGSKDKGDQEEAEIALPHPYE